MRRWVHALLAGLLVALVPAAEARPASRKVLAFYYTWYGTPGVSGAWRHWDEGGHRPDGPLVRGMPDIGATDHPLELYDSNDPVTLRRHLAQAREAGIDALISTWWRPDDYHDRAFRLLLREAEATPVKVTVYYEIVPTDPDPVGATASGLEYILDSYGRSKAFFRDDRGAPVIFIYGRAMGQLTREQWAEVARRVRQTHKVSLIADSTDPAWLDIFDGLHEYNPVGAVVAREDLAARAQGLVQGVRRHEGNKIAAITVIPGYDDSHIGRQTVIVAPRENGRTYRRMWTAAKAAQPDWVIITSFNEWHEGSEIEPSREHGDTYLRLTADYGRLFKTEGQYIWRTGYSTGFRVRPSPGLYLSLARDRTGPLRVENLSLTPGELTLGWPRHRDLVVVEEGRDNLLWRIVPSRVDSRWNLVWRLGSGRAYQVWLRSEFEPARPRSPFALPISLGLQPEVTGEYAAAEPLTYRVFPGHAFPLQITLRNQGKETLRSGRVRLMAPEGWVAGSETQLFDSLAPGAEASASLEVTPDATADLGEPYPVLVWYTFQAGGEERRFWTAVDLQPVRPLEPAFSFGESNRLQVRLTSAFPALALEPVTVEFVPGDGRTANPESAELRVSGAAEVSTTIEQAADLPPALRRTFVTLRVGSFASTHSVADTATVDLGAPDGEHGLRLVEPEDGRTETLTAAGSSARRPLPFGDSLGYLYLSLTPAMPRTGPTYITVEYLDQGRGSFQLQYDSTDAALRMAGAYKDGETVTLADTGEWKSHTFAVADGRFAGRQNGGADLRFALTGLSVPFRRVTASKWQP